MTDFNTIDDLEVSGKTVLVRADLNVPMQDGKVSDTTRIDRLAPTLKELSSKGAKVVVLSHFGRPKNGPDTKNSLRNVLDALSAAVGQKVAFAEDCVGEKAKEAIAKVHEGAIVLLENTRFHAEEEKNDPAFARQMAELGDLYVNDAFSAAHRAHASTEGVARLLPSAAGRLMEAELKALTLALEKPERPVAAVVGGAKISTKLELLGNMVRKVDLLVLGGGMANTFLFAQGTDVGASLCEKDMADQARAIMATAKEANCEILLPKDFVVAKEFKAGAANRVVAFDAIGADEMALDIGPATVEFLGVKLQGAKTIVWNGPLGAFEIQPFDAGTNAVAGLVAARTEAGGLLSVAGGGDTVAALAHAGAEDKFTYVSAAGGAFLEWLEGKELPGVAALKK
ncbi:phosphoglycerate kinase [Azospirillum lipoferum]|uniref:Phosphoglycerate kinase n=1 Tax=Azospirillum lipoferum TaxID=193 RepID=A0A5A9GVS4_AZOLI|nr:MULTISPECIES: phosphoglycerate kinase [Azospirillum]KAA0597882.1 phosphoglycerate kinase [Azospirillum lipoferum]MCP1609977.1 phosphoglycerate kinase [Azospirillum lipoferum]MDW5534530.1 phosphoglycerate kinase [Azospirillum sp. NL1]